MGYRKFILTLSIKSQIILAVILILVCSFLSTMLTDAALAVIMRPSVQAVEKSNALLEKYITTQGAAILNPSEKPKIQSLVQATGGKYVVMNSEARSIYGTLHDTTITNKADMIRKLNVTSAESQDTILGRTVVAVGYTVIPVLGTNGSLDGAVYIRWFIYPGPISGSNIWNRIDTFTHLLSPFLYMLLFTYIFSQRIGKQINRPLRALIEATRRIKQRDLDFCIDYQGNNEISKVLDAFEDMRKELKASLFAQWKLEEERREMLAAISHDLRTPITIIQGHVENLMENPSQEKLQRSLETVVRNTHRMTRLMNDFRTVTEIDSPVFLMNPVKTDVEEYIESKFNEFLVVTRSHAISLLMNFKDNRSNQDQMSIDTDRISQIIDNLMANAIRFTPKDGQICWSVQVEEEKLEVAIKDSGQGIPTSETSRLFDKFYQADKSRSREKGHSGLGLYIVKALVEKHGGTVTAKNNPLGGATFQFYVTPLNMELPSKL